MNLPIGTLLKGGTYRITRFIGSGGFGCTYEALHTELEERVAIKEFFVKNFCNRDESTSRVSVATQSQKALVEKLRSKFKDEAKAMFRLRHPGIVRVSDVFEENGTVYYVMDFIEGRSLQAIVEEEGRLPEHRALKYVRQVADALRYIHGHNRLHLDVKPGNIMVDSSDNAILIDFGASKQYDEENGENTSTLVGKTPGYAPLEQMSNKVVRFFPATDIYALGATLYKLLTGVTPPDAAMLASGGEELSPLPLTVSGNTRRAVSSAMSLKKDDRPQDIGDFLNILDGGRPGKSETGQRQSGFFGTSGAQGRPGDSTVLDEKKNDGGHGRGAGNSGNGWGGNDGDVRGRVDKGVGEGRPSSSPNPNRAKVWLIAACVIVGLVAGFFLLRNLMSGGGQGSSGAVPSDSSLVAVSAPEDTPDDVSSRQPVSTGKEPVKPSDSDMSSSVSAKPSSVKPVASSASEPDNRFQAALDSKDEQIAALQQQIKEEREQRTRDSLAAVQRLKERRQHIKDSVAAAKRAEQEAAAKEEAARKAAEEKARQEAARKAAEETRSTTGTINGHQWVDLGLSVKWATCNVGASSPSDYGNYYVWGETRTKSEYTEDNSSTYGINIGDISGDSRYDAARANWGGTWRLPTEAEMEELMDKCTWTWTSQGGHNGYRVTGPNGSSIFLPAAGYRDGSSLYNANVAGYYHNSTPDMNDATIVYQLFIDNSRSVWYAGSDSRYSGQSVRPVSD